MRKLRFEQLEPRHMLTPVAECGDGSGSLGPIAFDLDRDGMITPADVLLLVNGLNAYEAREATTRYDVNCDGLATPLDALLVIDHINRLGISPAVYASWQVLETPTTVPIAERALVGILYVRVPGGGTLDVDLAFIAELNGVYNSAMTLELYQAGETIGQPTASIVAGGTVQLHSGQATVETGVVELWADTHRLSAGDLLTWTMIRTEWSPRWRGPAAAGISWGPSEVLYD